MTVLRDYAAGIAQPALLGGAGSDSADTRYDEVIGPDGTLRTPWKGLAEVALGLSPTDLDRIDREIVDFLADDGVTYSRPGHRSGPWRLDPMPLVLDAPTWTPLEVGLAQRAELLNAILIDLYGEQRLLREGVVPAAAVLGHSGFSRSVARASMTEPRPLVLAATDLGRDTSGEWKVLADRAQAPSGIGYAMENRRVLLRVLPELYREAELHRMEPYFWALRSALQQSASGDLADPRVVVLSPGPHSETAYDQANLASMLGFPLVQGSDLVVRDGWVQMKQPGGGRRGRALERVDVILRRVDAAWSDPLELRGDSRLGVAGLVEAARRGRVRIVNGLGSGVLENPALLPYMADICEVLLGESLRLDSVPTWWCGEPTARAHVLDHLDELSVRTIDGPSAELSDTGPAELERLIAAAPHRYVGQERMLLSQSPTWPGPDRHGERSGHGTAQASPITLRTFTLRYGSAYRPLVGGLANVLEGDGTRASKDVWVLKSEPGEADQGLSDVLPMTSTRSDPFTSPRVLEDMFWFGRYAERSEDLLRLVLASHSVLDDFRARPRSTGGAVLGVMRGALRRLAGQAYDEPDQEFRSLLLDPTRDGSAAHALAGLRDALAGVRDQLSLDVWRAFGVTDRAGYQLETSRHSHQVPESAGRMLTGILSLQGVTASMIRDPGWHMIGIGRSVERGIQLCHLLRATTTVRRGIDVDRDVLSAVLAAAESAVTHRRRYRGYVRTGGVLELLLTDTENPRSLIFALYQTREHLAGLPSSTGSTRPERLIEDLIDEVGEVDIAALVAIGGAGRPNLAAFLDSVTAQLNRVSDAVAELHLAAGPEPRSFGAFDLLATIEPHEARP